MDATGAPADSSMCPGFRPDLHRKCNLQACSNCTAAETCRGHGSCAQDGTCTCSGGYSGIFCQVSTLHLPTPLFFCFIQLKSQLDNKFALELSRL